MRNAIYWVEIPVTNFQRAKTFYEEVFDLEMMEIPMSRGKYAIFPLDKSALGGGAAIVEGKGYEPTQNGAVVYIDRGNENLSKPLSKVEKAGGRIVLEKVQNGGNPEAGFIAQFIDTEGNRIGLHSME